VKDILRRLSLLATTAVVVVGACIKGPAGPPLSGTWSGFLYLHDEYGAPLFSDSGITVTLGSTASDTSVTGPVGAYSFSGIDVGVYTLKYSGPGIGTFFALNQQFVGGGTVNIPGVNLGQISTGVITGFAMAPSPSGDTILATGTITAPPAGVSRYVRLFYSLTSNVGAGVTVWTVTGPSAGSPYAVSTAAFTIPVSGQDLLLLRRAFGSGKTVNVIAYADSYFENSYTDATTGKPIFPNVSAKPSNVTTFVMP
jgi:hypothetical protein